MTRSLSAVVIVLVVAAPAASAEVRLFTTAEERERLDQMRAEATAEQLAREAPAEPERTQQAPPKPPRVHLRGFVRRSDGPSAVWVNEGSTIEGIADGIRIDAGAIRGGSVVVRMPDGRRLRLEPGQSWEPGEGRVKDVTEQ